MQVDAFAIRLRPRGHWEAADLGVRLCQHALRSVFPCYWLVAVPMALISLATFELATWAPMLVLWWAKPWLDRTILFVLSRAAFGVKSTALDIWRAQKEVWWSQLLSTWTVRRFSPWRSLTQPVHQLEGLDLSAQRKRAALIRRGRGGAGTLLTSVYASIEQTLMVALVSLAFWFAPTGHAPELSSLFTGEAEREWQFVFALCYVLVVIFLEPFYVASGFAMYINRRVELEAWDIEQEFRRAFR